MHLLFCTTRGSNPGPCDPKSDTLTCCRTNLQPLHSVIKVLEQLVTQTELYHSFVWWAFLCSVWCCWDVTCQLCFVISVATVLCACQHHKRKTAQFAETGKVHIIVIVRNRNIHSICKGKIPLVNIYNMVCWLSLMITQLSQWQQQQKQTEWALFNFDLWFVTIRIYNL